MSEVAHGAFVEGWLETRVGRSPTTRAAPLLRIAVVAIWTRAAVILGDVTVAAMFRRVLRTARQTSSLLVHVRVIDRTMQLELDEVALAESGDPVELRRAIGVLLAELFGVFGRFTCEALTPGLEEALLAVGPCGVEHIEKEGT